MEYASIRHDSICDVSRHTRFNLWDPISRIHVSICEIPHLRIRAYRYTQCNLWDHTFTYQGIQVYTIRVTYPGIHNSICGIPHLVGSRISHTRFNLWDPTSPYQSIHDSICAIPRLARDGDDVTWVLIFTLSLENNSTVRFVYVCASVRARMRTRGCGCVGVCVQT